MLELALTLEPLLTMAGLVLIGGLFGAKQRPVSSADPGAAALEQRVRELEQGQRDLSRLSRETLATVERLHTIGALRDIPGVALDFLVKLFAPEEALVLIRRQPAVADTKREHQLIVAASVGRKVRRGTVLELGTGQLASVATRGVTLELPPDGQTPGEFPGFRPDLAVPMKLGDETIGVLTVSRARRKPFLGIRLLQFVAAAAAQTYKSSTTLNRVRSEADLDALTGVLNKGALSQLLDEFARDAKENGRPLSLFLFDIDHFKNYNDTNGHLAGDDCLRLVSRLVAERVRADDAFGRWGGEEFLLMLPGREPSEALGVAEEIRQRIADFAFPHGEKQPLGHVTVSGGVACLPDHSPDPTGVIEAADRALYSAKAAGRNRIESAPDVVSSWERVDSLGEQGPQEDNLERIQGIGTKFSERLRGLGFFRFRQIAELDWRGMARVAEALETNPERIIREQWLAQARELHRDKYGEEL